MPQLDDAGVATAAAFGGWTGAERVTAVAVALAESGGNTDATHRNVNGTEDVGLWQVNSVHGYPRDQLTSASGNARAAFEVWQKQGWTAWTVYKTGAYRLFLPRAQKVAAAGGTGEGTAPTLSWWDVIVKNIEKPFAWVGNPHSWLRVGYVVIGGGLILAGIVTVASNSGAVKAVGKVLPK